MPGAVRREATVDGREEDDMGEGGAGPVRREKASDGRTVGGGQWESALSEEENAILDMEERWWAQEGGRDRHAGDEPDALLPGPQ